MADAETEPGAVNWKGLAGGLVGALGEYSASSYARSLADRQRRLSRIAARSAMERGAFEASQLGRAREQLKGRARASFAAGGVEIGAGTAGAVEGDIAKLAEEDIGRARSNAALQAWGFKMEGRAAQEEGRMEQTAGTTRAGVSLLDSVYTNAIQRLRPASKPASYGGP